MDKARIFKKVVESALGDRSVTGTANAAGLPRDAIRYILKGHDPQLSRAEAVADVLGLEFYIGPPRANTSSGATTSVPREIVTMLNLPDNATVTDAIQAMKSKFGANGSIDVASAIDGISQKLDSTQAALEALADSSANDDEHAEARPIPVVEVASAAGAGSVIDMEEVTGQVWFRRDWLRTHGLDPNQCCVIGVKGDSMYPTLVDGCSILIDRTRTQRHAGHIYVIRTDDGLAAKRLTKSSDAWMLTSDNAEDPTLIPLPWNNNMEIIGEIRWMARSLDGKL